MPGLVNNWALSFLRGAQARQGMPFVVVGDGVMTLSGGDRIVTQDVSAAVGNWAKTRFAQARRTSGGAKWYFEVLVTRLDANAALAIGVAESGTSITTATGGTNNAGTGGRSQYFNDGRKRSAGTYASYGASYTAGDIIGCAIDDNLGLGNTRLSFWKNGVSQGEAYSSAGSASIFFQPHFCNFNNANPGGVALTSPSQLTYLPSGYSAWG